MKHYALVVFMAGAFSAAASAQNIKPGLWEHTNKMKSSSGEMEKAQSEAQRQMANMPPEQRKMMEEMMAKQGMKFGAGGPGGGAVQMCVTKEMAEKNEVPQRGDCKTTRQQRTGNTIKWAFSCANPPSSGEGEYTIISPEAYRSTARIQMTQDGKPETVTMESTGKWLSADCGSIKPPTEARAPKKK